MKIVVKGILCLSLFMGTVWAKEVKSASPAAQKSTAGDIQIFTSDNAGGKITPATIEAAFKKEGFFISANRDMNVPFKKKFKETSFDVYNLFTFFSKKETLELAKKYPSIGMFSPMSMSIYTKKGDKKISISSLRVEAMAKILKIPADDAVLVKIGAMVKEALKTAMPQGKFEALSYSVQEPKGSLVSSYEMEMDPEEWEDEKEEFKMEFEGTLSTYGFVIAGTNDLNHDFKENKYEGYDFYDVYSICKLPVIYTVAKTHPEAGAYAPCSLYMYKKKGENSMHLAFPSVYNWISSMDIKNKESLEVLEEAQGSMNKILSELTE
ncbi:hypothetical protein YH65_08675 [Sulfurovum lithotrophicum]|uniref:DUF302 domain-containing protein n=1 Tax=Sulfurovum lithotrophicum TaxID=206403 RepID=A0A7U4M232_9BACT|nr:hypothetical protein [Sulfurovum lithotrophicum]AKF25437.1 hypothetical protein YH65_08615 [Sulfurovum lithotrophicum]AKF25439.1 hypothetical protein YH65_08645 [Sulfurovum lithotrophicum]AKF25441.1 hypothetical protein YH65_08675 [Sulfurovum lithotrophicum]